MTISTIAYIGVSSLDDLSNFLISKKIDYSNHKDGAEEEELWIDDSSRETLDKLNNEFINNIEYETLIDRNVEYIVFYEH